MRSVWNGTIAFGDSNIPVRAYGATDEQNVNLHQLHLTDGGRVRAKRVCEIDGEEIPNDEVGKGYALPGGSVVMLTPEDFASLPAPPAQRIEICAFTPLDDIDPVYFNKSYYLEPEETGTKPYVLFSEALQQTGRVALVKVALRQRETLGVLRVRDQVIMLETMLWPDEIRTPDFPFLHEDVNIRLSELRTAAGLIEKLSGGFTPHKYTDEYREALQRLIQAKAEEHEVVVPTVEAQEAGAEELVSALRASVNATKKAKSTTPSSRAAAVGKAKTAAKKAADAKSTATKAATKARNAARTRN